MSVLIRKMRPDDFDAAIGILDEWNMAPVAASGDIENPERSELDVGKSFVAVDNGRVVGVCSYIVHSPELAETASLAVDPSCRGKGDPLRFNLPCRYSG